MILLYVTAFIHLNGELTFGGLASFTYLLESNREIATSRGSLEVAPDALEAADRPFVIPSAKPHRAAIDIGTNDTLIFRLWNLGPAMVCDIQLVLGDHEVLPGLPGFIPVHVDGAADQGLPMRGSAVDLIGRGELGDCGTLRVF